ncbi:MAG: thioredoxin domain-containing protein [Anaerolineae bacterium]|nr:thioredoxin domain-containing protein [Anaerolineae bacterium]
MEVEKPLAQPAEPESAPEKPKNDDHVEPVEASPVLVIPRVAFNYAVIAVVFLVIGGFIGAMITQREAQSTREVISEAVAAALEARADTVAAAPSLDDPNSRFTVAADSDPAQGPEDAQVVMVEFSDFNCTYCRRFASETLQPLLDEYGDRIRFVYRDYPILTNTSVLASLAGECLNEQGKFWEFHNVVFSQQISLDEETLKGLAGDVGADVDAFATCLTEQRHLEEVRADYVDGQSLGIRGTPMFFINGRPLSGALPYEQFATIIEQELAAAEQPAEAS